MFNRNLGPDIRFANIENNQIGLGEPNLKLRGLHRRKNAFFRESLAKIS